MRRYSNSKARIEKKVSKVAKELLLALYPSLHGNEFSIESDSFRSYRGTVWHDQHVVWFGPDHYGESDYQDCEWLLYSWLIDNTTDWDGIGKAHDAVGWDSDGLHISRIVGRADTRCALVVRQLRSIA